MFDRLSSQHSLTPAREHAGPNLTCSLEQSELEMSPLKKHIADLEAKNKGDGRVTYQMTLPLYERYYRRTPPLEI